MKRMIVTAVIGTVLGFGAGWAAGERHADAQSEDGNAVVGLVMGAYDNALDQRFPKPPAAPDHLNIALTVCDSRKALTPAARQVEHRDLCASRTLGWETYFTEAVNAKKAGRKLAPPFAGE